jgi:hypothetical protein
MWQLFLMALGWDYITDGEHPEGNPDLNRFTLWMLLYIVVGLIALVGCLLVWWFIRAVFSF